MIGKHANLNKTVKEEEASVSEDTHVLNTTSDIKKPLTKKKVAKRKRVSKKEDIEYAENAIEAKKLQEKFSSKKKAKDDDMAYVKVKNWDTKPKIANCEAHNNIVSRAEENQISRVYQIDFRPDVVQSQWKCALCHQRSSRDDLGDLFGPYYVVIGDHWPSFLVKKPAKMNRDETYWADVWFHGDCILWAPDVYMKGNSLTNLDSKINQFWKQKCCLCHHEGAAIPVGDKYVHFPCAKKHGYHMNEALFSCHA